MSLLIKGLLLFVVILLAGRMLNRFFPPKQAGNRSEDEAPIIDVPFRDVAEEKESTDQESMDQESMDQESMDEKKMP
ncbi:MAG: hypothetical protein RR387_05520 [Clostridiales bacterium]